MKQRQLDETFMEALKSGVLKSLLIAVQEDDTLCMELRGDSVNIYYRGGSLFKISQKDGNYILSFDTNYTEGKMSLSPNPSVSEAVENIPFYKRAMDCYFHAHPHYEREFQQTLLRENNNSGNISRATDYYIVDIEYADADARFDMVAFKWISNGATRKNNKKLSLALIEVKYGDGALDGTAGIKKHLKDFNEFLGNKDKLKLFRDDMETVFKQKCELGLMDGLQDHQFDVKLTEEVETIFIFANHDPDSKKLDKILDSIDWAEYQPFPVYAARSSKMGYGLFVDCLQDLRKQ